LFSEPAPDAADLHWGVSGSPSDLNARDVVIHQQNCARASAHTRWQRRSALQPFEFAPLGLIENDWAHGVGHGSSLQEYMACILS
jgi:hypothetical protein